MFSKHVYISIGSGAEHAIYRHVNSLALMICVYGHDRLEN